MDIESIKTILLGVLSVSVPAIVALLIYLTPKITSFIKTKSTEIIDSIQNEKVKKYLEILRDNAVIIVNSLNQQIVNDLKASHADGKLTEEEIKQIASEAILNMHAMTSEDVKETMKTVYNDLDLLFTNLIEEAVGKVKKEN